MPSRAVCWIIVIFWLATMGWFIRREILPQYFSDAPPPFVIDFSDEAVRTPLPVRWLLTRNGQRMASAQTAIQYHEADDTFTLSSTIWKFELLKLPDLTVVVEPFKSIYHVTRNGELRGIENNVELMANDNRIRVYIAADVKNGLAQPYCKVESPWGNLEPRLDPMPVGSGGALNPMHPVHRVLGLRLGQRWRLPMLDPLSDVQRVAIEAIAHGYVSNLLPKLPTTEARELIAEVTGPRTLEWMGAEHECFVIEYRAESLAGRTWVRIKDGLVLRQEAIRGGEELVMDRE